MSKNLFFISLNDKGDTSLYFFLSFFFLYGEQCLLCQLVNKKVNKSHVYTCAKCKAFQDGHILISERICQLTILNK